MTLQTALVVGVSVHTVNTYLGLHTEAYADPAYRAAFSDRRTGVGLLQNRRLQKKHGLSARRPK